MRNPLLSKKPHAKQMPCACQTPLPDYPTTDTWGPLLWTLFHALSERVGGGNPMFLEDEKQRWMFLLTNFATVIPCKECKTHAQEWVLAHPVSEFRGLTPEERKPWLRAYFYTFHEAVNVRMEHPSFDVALIESTYKSIDIRNYLMRLKPVVELAIRLDGVPILGWRNWYANLIRLLALYGI